MNGENNEVSQNIAELIGTRESAKAGSSLSALPERTLFGLQTAADIKKLQDGIAELRAVTPDIYKKTNRELTGDDINTINALTPEVIPLGQKLAEIGAVSKQGKFERKMSQAISPEEKSIIQKENEQYLNDEANTARLGETEVKPIDPIHEIANFENKIYDKIMAETLQNIGVESINTVSEEASTKIKQEVEKKMDEIVKNVGYDFLRSHLPGIVGDYFRRKSSDTIKKYL